MPNKIITRMGDGSRVELSAEQVKEDIMAGTVPMWPGDKFFENYGQVLGAGIEDAGGVPVGVMLMNSLIMALSITCSLDD